MNWIAIIVFVVAFVALGALFSRLDNFKQCKKKDGKYPVDWVKVAGVAGALALLLAVLTCWLMRSRAVMSFFRFTDLPASAYDNPTQGDIDRTEANLKEAQDDLEGLEIAESYNEESATKQAMAGARSHLKKTERQLAAAAAQQEDLYQRYY